jgi:hypothetical protein
MYIWLHTGISQEYLCSRVEARLWYSIPRITPVVLHAQLFEAATTTYSIILQYKHLATHYYKLQDLKIIEQQAGWKLDSGIRFGSRQCSYSITSIHHAQLLEAATTYSTNLQHLVQ